ncbi:MAG: hypothetical protein IKD78_03495, partial [Bacteroidales bacterium]|nr:hypothetical protein [Bacteroidales bacterium]
MKASPTGGGWRGPKKKGKHTMAVLYRVYKDNRENSLTSGQYFARAIHTDTIGLKEMAMEIEENVSVKYSDVSAVLIELVNVMNRHLNASRRVTKSAPTRIISGEITASLRRDAERASFPLFLKDST